MTGLLRNARPLRPTIAAAALVLGLTTPAFAKESSWSYLVPSADGDAPVVMQVTEHAYKEKTARNAIVKSGVTLAKDKQISYRKNKTVRLKGITDAKGKRVLDAGYISAWPISTRTAYVKRWDQSLGFVDLKTGQFRPLPENSYTTVYHFDTKAPLRMVLGNPDGRGTFSICVVGVMGRCDGQIRNADGHSLSNDSTSSVYGFPDKFLVRHRDGARSWSASYRWDQSVIASPLPPLMGVQRLDENGSKIRFNSVLFELPAPRRRIGKVNTKLYWPMDDDGNPAQMPDDFVGMFPFQPIRWDNKHVGAWRGYVVIRMIDGEERYYVGDRVKVGFDTHFTPYMLAVWPRLLAGPFSDIWINSDGENVDIADVSKWQTLALRKPGGSELPQWVSAERLDPTVPLMKRLTDAQASTLTTSDPALATRLQFDTDARRRDAAFAAFKAESAKRDKAMADLRAIPRTFTAAPGSCYPFYDYAKTTALGMEPGIFVRAYDTNPTEACRFVPESLYVSMERAGLVRSGGTADEPPKKTLAQQVDEWNKELDRQSDARDLERATTGRTCVKVVHVLYC